MMLKRVEAQCFRQIKKRRFDFGPGLVVIRAPNEGGKTTLIELIGYCLFGTKALRDPLDDVVTWGEPVKKLRTLTVLLINGETYTVKRSKSGAEVKKGKKVIVTGQNECTQYIERLLGVPRGNAFQLLIAEQNDIRGALDRGSKAIAELIENLADFKQIDSLIDLINRYLPTGNPSSALDRLSRAEGLITTLAEKMIVIDTAGYESGLEELKNKRSGLELQDLRDVYTSDSSVLQQAEATVSKRMMLTRSISEQEEEMTRQERQRSILKALPEPDVIGLENIKAQLDIMKTSTDRLEYYQQFLALEYQEDFWEGNRESFLAAWNETVDHYTAASDKEEKIAREIAYAESEVVVGTHCDKCGQALQNMLEIKIRNTELAEKLSRLTAEIATAKKLTNEAREAIGVFEGIDSAERDLQAFPIHPDLIKVDHNFVPFQLAWSGKIPLSVSKAKYDELGVLLAKLNAEVTAYTDARSKLTVLDDIEGHAIASLAEAKRELAGLASFNLSELRNSLAKSKGSYLEAEAMDGSIKLEIDRLITEYKVNLATLDEQKKSAKNAKDLFSEAKQALIDLQFNNNLLKSIRTARPLIADRLWQLVLTTVSSYFTQMRNQPSLVTKDKDGFKVDGKGIKGLSGSTLDILGLAIRIGLMKTFMPETPMVLLDEPSSGCDSDRTLQMSGLLLGIGFQQTLLVTHKDVDEGAANQLLEM